METITISKSHYNRLIKDQKFLRNLEAAGVDNWEGYNFGYGDSGENDFDDFDKLDDEDLDDDPEELPTP